MATYVLEIDWDNNGTFNGGVEDVSAFLRSVRWSMGRTDVNVLGGRASAGVLSATLYNTDNRFNSFNSGSPLAGNLLPGRAVRLRMTAPVTVTLWQGEIESITPTVTGNQVKRAEIRAFGPIAQLTGVSVRMAMSTALTTGALVDDVLDAAGYPAGAGAREIDAGNVTVTRFFTGGNDRDALGLIRELESSESGFWRETKDGKLRFEDSTHRQDHSATSQATFSDALSNLIYTQIEQIEPLDQVFNDIEGNIQLYSVQSLAVLWTHPEANVNGTAPEIGPGEVVTYFANYPNPASASEAVAVDAWTTPVDTTDYTANSASDGTGANHTSDIGIVVTKFDTSMKVVITNNAAVSVFLTLLQARGTAVHVLDPVPINAEDATSQTAYGLRRFVRSAPWVPTTRLGQGWADQQLEIHKDPQPAVRLGYVANRDTAHLTEAANRAISDRITVDADGAAGFGFNQDFFVERIAHEVQSGGAHRVEYILSSTAGLDEFWVLGTAGSTELGQTTRANYG